MSALTLGRTEFQRLIDEHPSVRLELLMALTERLRKVALNPTTEAQPSGRTPDG